MLRWDTGAGCIGIIVVAIGGFYAAVFVVAGIIWAIGETVEHFTP